MYIYTGEEMSALDKRVIEVYDIPSFILMENAARGVFEEIIDEFTPDSSIAIFCGTGNNGGDGLALARQLFCKGYRPEVFIVGEEDKIKSVGKTHLSSLRALKIPIYFLNEESDFKKTEERLSSADLICDAIIGTACKGSIEGIQKAAINLINSLPATIYALDVPSGINSKTGKICGVAVRAHKTISFGGLKRGLLLFPGAEMAGEVVVKDIGFPSCAIEEMPTNLKLLEAEDFSEEKHRPDDSHKGIFGTALIVAGSGNMGGAAILASKASYRSGAGVVRVLSSEKNRTALLTNVPEAIFIGYSEDCAETELISLFEKEKKQAKSILVGPGLGRQTNTYILTEAAVKSEKRLIIDADGLNILAEDLELMNMLKDRKAETVLTPHVGEMARLMGCDNSVILDDLIGTAQGLSKRYNIIIVLKSARTVIALPNGEAYISIGGCNGMATAGSGDVLAGTICALAANPRISMEKAALLGVYEHAKAGKRASEKYGNISMTAGDIAKALRF
ncbi:MAG: NAD(P)H-hydrate dehydratase [Ruminococcaceae bacterium]|nr:NAD(P)H-hydrate dehydratase [Oscillospiraceae bacterium]